MEKSIYSQTSLSDLEQKIQHFANEYYLGNELISDEEYDSLIEQLKKEKPQSILLKDIVGDDFIKGVSKKFKLPTTMGTLQKAHTQAEIEKWVNSHSTDGGFVCELKCDGNGQLLIYEDGKFVQSISRGNGEFGEDTTNNVSKVQGVVKEIPNFTGCIRGEVVLFDSVFEKHFKNESNPRNSAAGRIKQKTGKDCEKLNFIAYDVFSTMQSQYIIDIISTEALKLQFLEQNGFQTPLHWIVNSVFEIVDLRNNIPKFRKQVDYGIDGIVVKQYLTNQDDLQRHIPMTQIAFKPEPQIKSTTIQDIQWQLAGTQLTPVAILKPIEIDGAMIERVGLSNINIMNKLGVYVGATVFVKRSGMVIPAITSVLEPKQNAFAIPTHCPECGISVSVNASGSPICENQNCKAKLKHRFVKMFDVLEIKGTGAAFIDNVINEAQIKNVEDFIKRIISEDPIIDDWAGGINGRKIIKQLKKALSEPISTAKFLATFDYPGFAEKNLKLLEKDLDSLYEITEDELLNISGFAEISAQSFLSFMSERKDEIECLRKYFNIVDKQSQKESNILEGLSFCFTGAACRPRAELQKLVEEHGGMNKSSVVKGLNYLVTDDVDSGSSKNKKAQQLGIAVLSSTEFLNMIEERLKIKNFSFEESILTSADVHSVLKAKRKKL